MGARNDRCLSTPLAGVTKPTTEWIVVVSIASVNVGGGRTRGSELPTDVGQVVVTVGAPSATARALNTSATSAHSPTTPTVRPGTMAAFLALPDGRSRSIS